MTLQRNTHAKDSDTEVIEIKTLKPSLVYLDRFIGLKCAPELLKLDIFPNAKEITEAMGMWGACSWELNRNGWEFGNERTICVVVGDGSTPRLGAMMAFRSRWTVISVDPNLSSRQYPIERLTCVKSKIEDLPNILSMENFCAFKYMVLLACRSHVGLIPSIVAAQEVCPTLFSNLAVIAMPCCKPLEIGNQEPDVVYQDWGVFSPERTIKIWRGVDEKELAG